MGTSENVPRVWNRLHLGEKQRTIAHCLFANYKPPTIKFQTFCVFYFCLCIFLGTSTLVRAAMDSDDEIFLTQNTFSQESPELNLEELVGDLQSN